MSNRGAELIARIFSDWERIKSPAADQIVAYDSLKKVDDTSILNKLAVLKVNGGLGTSMGAYIRPPRMRPQC